MIEGRLMEVPSHEMLMEMAYMCTASIFTEVLGPALPAQAGLV